jgi:hypothetical protein
MFLREGSKETYILSGDVFWIFVCYDYHVSFVDSCLDPVYVL